ncbi:Cell surface spherulin 4-like protein [Penicillium macrosclerotiorum]|uniref:Cell surface spherulin 4-like protein n=1 Tax=Penicillium macrosclerotiorum TaxID=303699 RepID=UPI002547351F|nr:Cell surface spherulin 4-like protein [Penicillium macrosclerotiorum]KAJ5669746.1 Cell surface spherulin 4-like protein [Penicillium macrosclerotiorum]
MRTFSCLVGSALAMASAVSATGILLPLYSWPEDNSTWGPVYNAVYSYPDVHFQIIVNPSSGPGDTTYPDESYIAGVAQLNSYDNVEVIGYIPTNYAERTKSEVVADIKTYAGWSSYTKKNITVSGIFFDEAPRTNENSKISYMKSVSATAKKNKLNTVVFNPGTKLVEAAASKYFAAADLIVEFENSYSEWVQSVPKDSFSSAKTYYKDAALLYSAPLTADYEAIVQEAEGMGLGAAYLTNDDDYKSVESVKKVAASFSSSS